MDETEHLLSTRTNAKRLEASISNSRKEVIMNTASSIYEEVKSLPEPLAQEVLDFVTFIKKRRVSELDRDLMKAQAPAMESIWNNESDEVWNNA